MFLPKKGSDLLTMKSLDEISQNIHEGKREEDCDVVKVVVVVVALSSLARILGECSTIHSPPVLYLSLSPSPSLSLSLSLSLFKWIFARVH